MSHTALGLGWLDRERRNQRVRCGCRSQRTQPAECVGPAGLTEAPSGLQVTSANQSGLVGLKDKHCRRKKMFPKEDK